MQVEKLVPGCVSHAVAEPGGVDLALDQTGDLGVGLGQSHGDGAPGAHARQGAVLDKADRQLDKALDLVRLNCA